MSEHLIRLTGSQLKAALEFIAPDGTEEQLKSEIDIYMSAAGNIVVFEAECPEEGGIEL